ncbi:MAG TPA: ParB/RepB/Spo0J family partition protein [Candidatus Eisenbacteria bacterium]|nr:ParB/RepB/Spo0J family partition protein [Candidatus Eisenbacteria bacterium]
MTDKRKVLGRGLETLLPSRQAPAPGAAAPAHHGETIHQLAVELIDRNPYQTRTHVDEAALQELTDSIKATGVLQPITVRAVPGGRYQLIAGERRWLASQHAGKPTVPAIVRQVSNEQAMEMTIIENLQREDLNPIEQARAFERLGREFGLTQEQISLRTGKERSSVANFLRLLRLPEAVQAWVAGGHLSVGHAKALLGLDSPRAMVTIGSRVVEKGLSVRETEDAVANMIHPVEHDLEKQLKELMVDPNVKEAERTLERALGVKVTIKDRKGKGRILLEYASLEDFDRILDVLSSK